VRERHRVRNRRIERGRDGGIKDRHSQKTISYRETDKNRQRQK